MLPEHLRLPKFRLVRKRSEYFSFYSIILRQLSPHYFRLHFDFTRLPLSFTLFHTISSPPLAAHPQAPPKALGTAGARYSAVAVSSTA
jgi:hypothetical protein